MRLGKLDKKGQTEDIFADLIPSIIIIAITLFIVGFVKVQHSDTVEARIMSAGNMPLKTVALLKTPVDLPKLPAEYKGLSLEEIAGAIEQKHGLMVQNKKGHEWLEDAEIASDSFSIEQGILWYYGKEGILDCRGDFREFLHKVLMGSDKTWGYLLEPFKVALLQSRPPEMWMVELDSVEGGKKAPLYVCVSPFGNYNYLLNKHKGDAEYVIQSENFTIPSQEHNRQILVSVTFWRT